MTKAKYPVIYDIETDSLRPATQEDLDNFGAMNRAWGRLSDVFKTNPTGPMAKEFFQIETEKLMKIAKANYTKRRRNR